jgi:hypothetical protein
VIVQFNETIVYVENPYPDTTPSVKKQVPKYQKGKTTILRDVNGKYIPGIHRRKSRGDLIVEKILKQTNVNIHKTHAYNPYERV